jgi:thiamine pyrophosphokinase
MDGRIRLPQVTLSSPRTSPGTEILLVAGGRKPRIPWLIDAAEGRTVWAIDRGVNVCMEGGILPALILGDADSASPKLWKAATERGSEVLSLAREKDDTDLQMALRTVTKRFGRVKALVTGCWGGRFDHTWSNVLSVLGALRGGLEFAALADHRELLTFVTGGETLTLFHAKEPAAVSLLAFSGRCTGVSISGVHWPLEKTVLEIDAPYAISNRREGTEPTVTSLEEGEMGVYVSWWER